MWVELRCKCWTCKGCRARIIQEHLGHCETLFRGHRFIYILDCSVEGRGGYGKVRRQGGSYVRVTNNGQRRYYCTKDVKGSVQVPRDQVMAHLEANLKAITTGGKHVSYSVDWKIEDDAFAEKWTACKEPVSREVFVMGLKAEGIHFKEKPNAVIATGLTNADRTLNAMRSLQEKRYSLSSIESDVKDGDVIVKGVDVVSYTANCLIPTEVTQINTLKEAIIKIKKDDGIQSAFDSIQPKIKREYPRCTLTDQFFIDCFLAEKNGLHQPSSRDLKYIKPTFVPSDKELCPY